MIYTLLVRNLTTADRRKIDDVLARFEPAEVKLERWGETPEAEAGQNAMIAIMGAK